MEDFQVIENQLTWKSLLYQMVKLVLYIIS